MAAPRKDVIYGGAIEIERDTRHRYWVTPTDGSAKRKRVPTSSTGVVRVVDDGKTDNLMKWAVGLTVDYFRTRLRPGQSLDELKVQQWLREAPKAWRAKRDRAGDFGNAVHDWVQLWAEYKMGLGEKPMLPQNLKVRTAVLRFLAYAKVRRGEVIFSERLLYSLEHNYAGGVDVGFRDEETGLEVWDVKTSNYIPLTYSLQLASYTLAAQEEFSEPFKGRVILHVPRDRDGELEPIDLREKEKYGGATLEEDQQAFLHALGLWHRINRKVK